ncbi:MAG: aldolase [Candidatus Hydrogenedentes bacterium]|nr:aldolase [Candidatus Hydrogenedentota bacterium]
MTPATLRAAVRSGQRVYGTCITSTSPVWPPMFAGCGLDFVFIDTEHIPIDRYQLSWMCRAYEAAGLPPIVRIPKCDAELACMALDGGAAGIVAPYMESVEEVQLLRGAVKYRPLKGARLRDVLSGKETLSPELEAYLGNYGRDKLLIVNVESTPAIAALDELVAVPDVDALLIGPHDLSISLGIPEQYKDPRFTSAIDAIVRKGRGAGLGVGYHFSFGLDEAIAWAQLGANFIVHSTDLFLVRDTLSAEIGRFRATMGDERREGPGETVVV